MHASIQVAVETVYVVRSVHNATLCLLCPAKSETEGSHLAMSDTPPSRLWSCGTLLRGSSFLEEQRSIHKSLSYEEIVGVSKLHIFFCDLCFSPMYT